MLDNFSVFAGRNPLKVATGDTSLRDVHFSPESDLPSTSGGNVFQYNESHCATSLNRGHGEPQGISQSDTESDKQFSPSHRSTIQSEKTKSGLHESYELNLSKRNDKDDEESENDTDVFANSTQSTHVAKSNHCDDDTSIQSSIEELLRHNESNGATSITSASLNRGHDEPQENSQSSDKQFPLSHRSTRQSPDSINSDIHESYESRRNNIMPEDKDDEESKSGTTKPTESAYVAKSKHCDDHTSKQSTRTSVAESQGMDMEIKSSFDLLKEDDCPEAHQLRLLQDCDVGDRHFDGLRIETIDQTAAYPVSVETVRVDQDIAPQDSIVDQPQDDDRVQEVCSVPQNLTVNDLASVQTAVWEGRARWYNIGLQLGLDPGTLEAIEIGKQSNPDRCFTETLKEWLSSPDLHPSWSSLARSLRAPPVGLEDLAEKLLISQPK